MTRLSHRFALDRLTTLQQKIRAMTIEVFGHEGLQDAELVQYTYCPKLRKHTYQVCPIRRDQLAKRKLLNPLKHLKFLVASLFIALENVFITPVVAPQVMHSTARILTALNNSEAKIIKTTIDKQKARKIFTLFVFYSAWRYLAKAKPVYQPPNDEMYESERRFTR